MRKFIISFLFFLFVFGSVNVLAADTTAPSYEFASSTLTSNGYVKKLVFSKGDNTYEYWVKGDTPLLLTPQFIVNLNYGVDRFSARIFTTPNKVTYRTDIGMSDVESDWTLDYVNYPVYYDSTANNFYNNNFVFSSILGEVPIPDPVPDTSMGYIKNVNVSYGPVVPVSDPVNNSYFINLPDADSSQAYEIIGTFRFPTTQYVLDTGNPLTATFPTRLLGLRFGSMQNNWYEITKSAKFTGGTFGFDVMNIGNIEYSSNENLSQSEIKVGSMLGYLKSFIIRKVTIDSSGNVLTFSGWSTVNVPKWDIDGSLTSGAPYPIVVDYEAYPDADQQPSSTDVLEDWLNGTQDYYDKVLPEENRDAWNDISGDTYNDYLDNAMNNEDIGSGISRLTSFARSLSAVPDLIAVFFGMFPREITYLMLLSLTLVPIVLIVKIL